MEERRTPPLAPPQSLTRAQVTNLEASSGAAPSEESEFRRDRRCKNADWGDTFIDDAGCLYMAAHAYSPSGEGFAKLLLYPGSAGLLRCAGKAGTDRLRT